MSEFLDFVKGWAKGIGGVFGDYPLAAAIITLVAVVAFIALERRAKSADWTTRTYYFFIALVGWAIAVPILGFIFKIIEKFWGAAEGAASAIVGVSLFLYHAYEKHTLLVLILLAISVTAFFAWHFVRPKSPSRTLKGIACGALFLLSVAVGAPIANLLSPTSEAVPPTTKPASVRTPAPVRSPAPVPASTPAPSATPAPGKSNPALQGPPASGRP